MGERRWVSDFRSLLVAEKNLPSRPLSLPSPAVDDKLAVPVYFGNGFPRLSMRRTVDETGAE